MAFAVDADLVTFVPTIFENGVDSFSNELQMAEDDIVRMIQVDWFNKKYTPSQFDKTNLTETQWNKATIYYALGHYILPRLATWNADNDSFLLQAEFYRNRFKFEYDAELSLGIKYDRNNDGQTSSTEVYSYDRTRMWR